MQFAGQRTSMDLRTIGKPDNLLVKLTDDVLPDPDAVLVHGITPQKTQTEGLTEAEFLKHLNHQVFLPDTIFVGFNNIRFDNNFMRFTLWRNFYDAYEWSWKNGCSSWDLLDVVRMTRALRPVGIKWPFTPDGQPSNRLEDLAALNKLKHTAHDALSDVAACIDLAKLLKTKQPKLFNYLLNLRDKNKVAVLVNSSQPFVYTSGRYPSEFEKTTVAVMVTQHPTQNAALVYDLRVDPTLFLKMTPSQLAELWSLRGKDVPYFPLKVLSYNRCPAIAPISVLDKASAKRLALDKKVLDANLKKLICAKDFSNRLADALEIVEDARQVKYGQETEVDAQLYDGFVPDSDKPKMNVVRTTEADQIANLSLDFSDERLKLLFPLYKARNFPKNLSAEEKQQWKKFRVRKLLNGGTESPAARYFKRIEELKADPKFSSQQKYLLEELDLYASSILPLPLT